MRLMIDIETTATSPTAGILSIGAVTFDHTPDEIAEHRDRSFYYCILPSSVIGHPSFEVSESTMVWWNKEENAEAKKEAFSGIYPIHDIIGDFALFVGSLPVGIEIWCKGKFDTFILEHAFKAFGIKCPWEYWQVRDFRTFSKLEGAPTAAPFTGLAHCALEDAINQAEHAEDILKWHRMRGIWKDVAWAVGVGVAAVIGYFTAYYGLVERLDEYISCSNCKTYVVDARQNPIKIDAVCEQVKRVSYPVSNCTKPAMAKGE